MLEAAMASPEVLAKNVHAELDRAVVAPLFAEFRSVSTNNDSFPAVVLEHRFQRARGRILDALVSRGSAKLTKDLRREVENLVRDWAAAAFSDAFGPVELFEVRCAREHDLVAARASGDPARLLDALEQAYRRKIVEQFGRIELRGIQTSHRVLQELDVVYVPLHLEAPFKETRNADGETVTLVQRQRIEVREALAAHRQLLVVGAPGSGKTTLVAYLAMHAVDERLRQQLDGEALLPLVLTVRTLKSISFSASKLAEAAGCDPKLVHSALEQRRALVLIDGLDEAPPELHRRLIAGIRRFVDTYPGIRLVATSRPTGAPGEIETSLHVLQPFSLVALTREEVDDFVDKWCLAAERSIRSDPAEAAREAGKAADDLKQRLAKSRPVQRIATNPLLVTILCVVHRFLGRSIPEHRVTLYDKCTDALLYEWDRAKFAEGASIGLLDAPAKRRLLMGIARKVHLQHAAEISENQVVENFGEILPDLGRPQSDAKQLVEEIRDRSGLLVERRPGFFAFSHLTFQEYFCALDFVRTKSLDDLVTRHQDPWWHEVILLAAGLPGASGGAIPRRLLAKRNSTAIFLAAQCLETEADMPLQLRERIDKAIQRLIPPHNSKQMGHLVGLGVVAAPLLARALNIKDAEARAWTLLTLGEIDYEPAIPAIAQCVPDSRRALVVSTPSGFIRFVGGLAALILVKKARNSEIARIALKNVRKMIPLGDHQTIQRWNQTLNPDFPWDDLSDKVKPNPQDRA